MIQHNRGAATRLKVFGRGLIPILLIAFVWLAMLQPAYADLVPRGAEWKYSDDGSGYQTGWQYPEFDDSSWSSGFGQFGYGDGDESTLVSYGADTRNRTITTFFRHQFDVLLLPSTPLKLRVQRDDGVIVYLNGVEVFRNNMRDGVVGANTTASSAVRGSDESAWQTTLIDPESLVFGTNTFAVEIHLANRASVDLSFDLQLTESPVVRGPYLQQSSETGITVRWRTATDHDAVLRYGTDPANLDQIASEPTPSTEHTIALSGLEPGTRYYYSIGDSEGDFPTGDNRYFNTHPIMGSAASTRIWVLGDSGTADAKAASVRNAYTRFNEGSHSDVWLMLGDNAYNEGTDDEYQAAVFDMYPQALRNSVLWPTLGNHDAHTADSNTQSGNYYDIFTLPTNAESGGVASGTEAYYSFNYGNIHFVSLDSHDSNRSVDGAMATWLKADLAANTQEWIIAYWHHPPYSKGSHDSDTEQRLVDMRTNFVPILESHGVDLVLAGHSHSYERSMLIDGHHGTSDSFNSDHLLDGGDGDPTGDGAYTKFAGSNNGSVYSAAGSSGKLSTAPLDHPVMISNVMELGSMVIDVQGNQLDAIFLDNDASVRDSFRIVHQPPQEVPPVGSVEIGSAFLDHDRINGPRWTRVLIDPLITGEHTIRVNWSGSADVRFTLFRVRAGTSNQFIETIDTDSPAQWIGTLDRSEQYYLGVWSASGSASFTAIIEEGDSAFTATIDEGTLDASSNEAPRWVRHNFESSHAGEYTINVVWDNNEADVRYRVNEEGGTNLSPTIRGVNPGTWTGMLEANSAYFIGLWSKAGMTNYTATIEASDDF